MTNDFVVEWPSFIKVLSNLEFEYEVTWSRDEKRGIPIAKVSYVALLEESINMVSKWWSKQIS